MTPQQQITQQAQQQLEQIKTKYRSEGLCCSCFCGLVLHPDFDIVILPRLVPQGWEPAAIMMAVGPGGPLDLQPIPTGISALCRECAGLLKQPAAIFQFVVFPAEGRNKVLINYHPVECFGELAQEKKCVEA